MSNDENLLPSQYFPELTEEEARHIDGETSLIAERRARVMSLYRRGEAMHAIARVVGCSVGTVHRDIHAVMNGYKRIAARSAQDHIANMLQLLAHREGQIEAELDRARGEQVETQTGRRTAASGSPSQEQAMVKRKVRTSDPAKLLGLLQGYWDRRCKLLGLLDGQDFGKGDLPPVKIIAGGIDPVELVQ